VVYFAGQKSQAKIGNLSQQDKNQNKKQKRQTAQNSDLAQKPFLTGQNLSGNNASLCVIETVKQINYFIAFITFCFLSKRFFVKRLSIKKSPLDQPIKNKNQRTKSNDRWSLSARRHLASNRPQQNHADSLGRSGINSQSPERQSGLALLYQRAGRGNYSLSPKNQLLPQRRKGFEQLKVSVWSWLQSLRIESAASGLITLSFLISQTTQYVLAKTKILYDYSLADYSDEFLRFTKAQNYCPNFN
jgi:hypothetical protein